MKLSTRRIGQVTLVAVHDDADVAAAGELRTSLNGHSGPLIVDLTDTTFIDSAVLNALVATHRRVTAAGGRFGVLCADALIRRPFEVTGLNLVFDMYSTLDEALKDYAGPPP